MTPRIPLTLVTGYLGAGKTTLVNALLRDASAGRIAVVVNEFGDIGLDHDLIVETTEETVLLASGCMCCTVRGDLVGALEDLFAKRASGRLAFDRIVIETTGLADPVPILHTLIVTPGLGQALRMDGVVTVCDAVNGPATLDRGFENVQQVAMADVLVLTKTDLVTPAQAAAFRARLSAVAPGAKIVTADRGSVPVAALFGHGAPEPGGTVPDALSWIDAPAYAVSSLRLFPLAQQAPAGPSHGLFGLSPAPASALPTLTPTARHDDRITSVSAEFDEPVHPMMLDLWIDGLIAVRGPDILRLKAVIWADGFDTPFVIHGVQHIIDPPIRLARWSGDRRSRVVIIGRDLRRDALLDSLDALRARPVVHAMPSVAG
jgi:G3E family GTPase